MNSGSFLLRCRFLLLAGLLLLPALLSCGRIDRQHSVVVWEQMDPQEQALFDEHVRIFRERHPEFADFQIDRVHYRVEDLPTQCPGAVAVGVLVSVFVAVAVEVRVGVAVQLSLLS